MNILFVDDEPDLEALITQKFRRHIRDGRAKFLFARDGIEALETLKANSDIDLVVSDINMPRMDGLSCCKSCRTATLACRPSSCRPTATWPISAPR